MRKFSIALLFGLLALISYVKFKPELTYYSGRIGVKLHSIGKISGSSVYRLNVPFHRQEHALSCEIASLKMALEAVGVNVSEAELISNLNFDTTPRQNGVWGDPYTDFVGDIDGKMMSTGYGVYWDPIARTGLKYRRTESITGGSLQQLIYHLNQGRPVVVWGYFGRGNRMPWTTPAGRQINAINGEHARVLVGYTGSMANPESLILLDPIYGELQWSVDEFLENWGALENGAVVVYKTPKWAKSENENTVWQINSDGNLKQGLAMDWDTFIAQGGVQGGVSVVPQEFLDSIPVGPPLKQI